MSQDSLKKIYASVCIRDGKAVRSLTDHTVVAEDPVRYAVRFSDLGADGLIVCDCSAPGDDAGHDRTIDLLREICGQSDAGVIAHGNVRRLEDVKKYLYAGCMQVIIDAEPANNTPAETRQPQEAQALPETHLPQEAQAPEDAAAAAPDALRHTGTAPSAVREALSLLTEAADRFGKEKLIVSYDNAAVLREATEKVGSCAAGLFLTGRADADSLREQILRDGTLPVILDLPEMPFEDATELFLTKNVCGVAGDYVTSLGDSLPAHKRMLEEIGVVTSALKPAFSFGDLKRGADGLVPVVVQDYRTDEVLMVAWMNEAAYQKTLLTGRMTYYSRSRQAQWIKGETSGHYQYVRALYTDCDLDTILAKVKQVGAACHTGARSCFFNEIAKRSYVEKNPQRVLSSVYDVIKDRREHPREGSYTNYLFDKGIDKILKKLGEESTEIVIAAKNPNANEIKYEIADYLYHLMVLMCEKGVTWEEITDELSRR